MTTRPGHDQARGMTPAAARILEAASRLYYEEGIRAVGMESIAAEADVTKKTIYDRFGSKDALVTTYLRHRDQRWRRRLCSALDAVPASDPREQILKTFDALGDWMRDENSRGCGFVNAYAELAEPEHPGRQVIIDQKNWLLELLTTLAERCRVSDPAQVAVKLFVLYEGAIVANSMGLTDDAAAAAKEVAAALVGSDTPRAAQGNEVE